MKTLNVQTFNTATPEQGGSPLSVSIGSHNFSKQGRKGKSASRHLLIGFDTEYQSIAPVMRDDIEGKRARNEILSYQYSVKLVEADAEASEPPIMTSGIIIPEENQRLFLNDFIVASVGALVQKYPDIILPSDAYLIGHFTRADLPAFEGFADHARRLLSNVRSTFVSIDTSQKLAIIDEKGNDIGALSIRMRDTMLLAPANAKSLAAIGDILGFPKVELADSPEEELRIKENMKDYRKTNWDEFREYAIRDAEICVAYGERIIRQNQKLFNEFKMPVTLTSFGRKLVFKGWEEKGLDPMQILGREEIETQKYSKKLGYFTKHTQKPFLAKVHIRQETITECFHGGRNEQYIFGIADEGDWNDIDLSSAYPTAMSLIGTPDWDSVREIDQIEELNIDDLGYAWVEFEFPRSVRFPTLPVRTAHGIIFPRKGESWCAAPELFLARRLGAELKIKTAIIVDTDKTQPIFTDFNRTCIEHRNKSEKGTFDNLFWKEVGNSTYGKTAQGLREKRVYDLYRDKMVGLPQSELTQPFFAAYITSYVRAVLGELLNGFPLGVKVFSATTDGMLTNATTEQIEIAKAGPLYQSFRDTREKLVGSDSALEVKHQIRQPLGWRTRGSATLKKGAGKNNIVIQKGGLKTKSLLNIDQQNSVVVELFFNRCPGQQLEYESGIGIKDMMRHSADFVFRRVVKRVSMEFDWKRQPVNAADRSVVFNEREYTHLSFETEPLENEDQFNEARKAWEKFNIKPFKCLKTKRDLEEFQLYLETNSTPNLDRAKYLRKTNGDIDRIRRDLCRALKHSKAGFELVAARQGRVSHASFQSALQECGIECSIADIDNGRRADFKAHQSFRTEKSLRALELLKQHHYPELDVEAFLEPLR
ncbi:hypothetical protein GF108_03195 [Phyllobacterium sp. SYP-B3895]|uniref:DNA polymerase n=1 Tax=Phyllobacterium sp. SYP-B3895 TaxID=2663240 RepID=UPI001299EAC8|nr:DNA polymerase [Phyllobacterium sp. SYP-B3895]MRG54589.1 hypothetical protein [Phyllobacterium sp. SYP-B3895]